MSLLNLHPYSRNMSFRGNPDKITFGGGWFEAYYAGFTDCSSDPDCPASYSPLTISGYTYCCFGVFPKLMVMIHQGGGGKIKIKSNPIALTFQNGDEVYFSGEDCPEVGPYTIDILDYQSWFTSDEIVSVDGFDITQTTFYDFENVCNCQETSCPEGMVFDEAVCGCVPDGECLDTFTVDLIISLSGTATADLFLDIIGIKQGNIKTLVTEATLVPGNIPVWNYTIATYMSKAEIPLVSSFLGSKILSAATDKLANLALIQVFGSAGQVISDLINISFETTRIPNDDPDCEEPPPDEECPPGYTRVNGQCTKPLDPPVNGQYFLLINEAVSYLNGSEIPYEGSDLTLYGFVNYATGEIEYSIDGDYYPYRWTNGASMASAQVRNVFNPVDGSHAQASGFQIKLWNIDTEQLEVVNGGLNGFGSPPGIWARIWTSFSDLPDVITSTHRVVMYMGESPDDLTQVPPGSFPDIPTFSPGPPPEGCRLRKVSGDFGLELIGETLSLISVSNSNCESVPTSVQPFVFAAEALGLNSIGIGPFSITSTDEGPCFDC